MLYETREGVEVEAMFIDFKEQRFLPEWVKFEIRHGRLSRTVEAKAEDSYFTVYNDYKCRGVRAYDGCWLLRNKENTLFWLMADSFKKQYKVRHG